MNGQTHSVPRVATAWRGDPQLLLERIGAAEELASPVLARYAWPPRRAQSLPALRHFLESYRAEVLIPLELPAIVQAHAHCVRYEPRELLALDARMNGEPKLKEFAAASCRVGQRQLNRLRPLRDHRLVQRYRAAIERGEAHGWHTLVYGVWLGVYSLPLHQGLLAYAGHTLGGFVERAARPLALTAGQTCALQAETLETVPAAVRQLLGDGITLRV